MEVTLLRTGSYQSQNISQDYLDSFYRTFDEVKEEHFDGLVITGAPVENLDFQDVHYWDELVRLMDWADHNVFSTLYICWAAQAGLYHFYGVEKHPLPKKMFGIFPHVVLDRSHKLVRGFDEQFMAPHSRHTTILVSDAAKIRDLDILATSQEAGLYLAASHDGRRVFVTGHSEYDAKTLELEYRRDQGRGQTHRDTEELLSQRRRHAPADDHLARAWLAAVLPTGSTISSIRRRRTILTHIPAQHEE